MTDRIVYFNSELFYCKEGIGNKTILLFHGFGQDHRAFELWNDILRNEYTIFSFDLFFHGNSTWENQQSLTKNDFRRIIQLFLDQENISNFEIAGFSIGARFALATAEIFPDRIDRLILLAPDGININRWYRFATSTSLMRSLFRSLVLKPRRVKFLISLLKLFHLENKDLLRFAEFQLGTVEKRRRVYCSWIYFRHLKVNLKEFGSQLNSRNTPAVFIMGNKDNVVHPEKIKLFATGLKNCQFHLIDSTHHDLIVKGVNYLGIQT